MFKAVVFTVSALCLAAPVFAQDDAKPKKAPQVCRSDTFTGSRMPKRQCHTAAQWAAIDSGSKRDADDQSFALGTASRVSNDSRTTGAQPF